MKKPFLFALVAAVYIANIVLILNFTRYMVQKETIFIPMAMLSLFVLSVAVMSFLFFYEPLKLFMENKRHEAVFFFLKTVGIFAFFVAIYGFIIFLI